MVNLKRNIASPQPRHLSKTYARKQRGRVVIGDVLYAKGGSFGPRIQEDFQLVVIHSGSLMLRLDHEVIAVPEGHAILLRPAHREHFHFARDRETRHSWIALSPDALDKDLSTTFNRVRGPFPFCGLMASLLDAARQDLSPIYEGEALHDRFHESLGISILCAFASAVCEGHRSSVIHETILWRMDGFLAENYARRLTLLEIAYAAGASRQHLLKLCRNAGKPTPTEQLYAKRLEVAADLLIHTGFSIAEIADRCGFCNQFHFSRKFRQNFNSSPSTWRGRLWKEASGTR